MVSFGQFQKRLGARIRMRRDEAGLTQEDFDDGSRDGVPVRTLADVETGKSNVTIRTLFKVARRLKIPVRDLFDFE